MIFKVQQFLYLFRAVTSSPTCHNKEHVEHISTHIITTQTHHVCSHYHFRKNAQNVGTRILSVSCQTHLMMPNSSIQSCCCYMSVCAFFLILSHPASTSDKNTTATEPAKTCKRHFTACSVFVTKHQGIFLLPYKILLVSTKELLAYTKGK